MIRIVLLSFVVLVGFALFQSDPITAGNCAGVSNGCQGAVSVPADVVYAAESCPTGGCNGAVMVRASAEASGCSGAAASCSGSHGEVWVGPIRRMIRRGIDRRQSRRAARRSRLAARRCG